MTRSTLKPRTAPLAALALAGLLTACGQASSSTTVVLTGPPDKVQALIGRHKLLSSNVQATVEKLPDNRQRAVLKLSKGLPMGEIIALGKDAANTGINYEFSSGSGWSASGSTSSSTDPAPDAPAPKPSHPGGPVA